MPNFLFRCAKVVRRTLPLGSGVFRAAGATAVVLLSLSLAACGGGAGVLPPPMVVTSRWS
jgi:manganese transport system substrate-binding protein